MSSDIQWSARDVLVWRLNAWMTHVLGLKAARPHEAECLRRERTASSLWIMKRSRNLLSHPQVNGTRCVHQTLQPQLWWARWALAWDEVGVSCNMRVQLGTRGVRRESSRHGTSHVMPLVLILSTWNHWGWKIKWIMLLHSERKL